MINCVIIEDEPLAQRGLMNLIEPYDTLNLLTVCDDVTDFISFREKNSTQPIDLLFLDIELPGTNGIHFLRTSPPECPVVLTTAYHEYALEGYALNVLDYLLKPISAERFGQTVLKAKNYTDFLKLKEPGRQEFIYVRAERVIEKIFFNELLYIEAMRNYVIYHCETRKLICYNSLKNAERSLPPERFVKVQKSFIVHKHKVDKIEKGFVRIQSKNIAIARENKSEIIKRLMEAG